MSFTKQFVMTVVGLCVHVHIINARPSGLSNCEQVDNSGVFSSDGIFKEHNQNDIMDYVLMY